MEESGSNRLDKISNPVRKKRTQTSRRPRLDSQSFFDRQGQSSLSSTPPSDDASKVSSDENINNGSNGMRKEFNLNQCISRSSSVSGDDGQRTHRKMKEGGGFNTFYNSESRRSGLSDKRSSEGALSPANWRSGNAKNGENQIPGKAAVASDGLVNESKVKKVKLKLGGVTRTIHANSSSDGGAAFGSSSKGSQLLEGSRLRQKQNLQGNLDDRHSPPEKRTVLHGVPWKDFSRGRVREEDSLIGKMTGKNTGDKSEPVRKSKRVPKKRVLDDDDEDDGELRYLEKLKSAKFAAGSKGDTEDSGKKRKLFKVSNVGGSSLSKDLKKKNRSDRASEDTDYEEEEEPLSDGEPEVSKKKKQRKESVDSVMDTKRELTLTMRQRALQSSKDGSSAPRSSTIEFPNGLPPAPSRKQKEKVSELEQQAKKAEAAQRRRMQVEKAARESEAEAIRKILGQDSSRKKREEQNKKRMEELAQEKAANELKLQTICIRTVMGPSGNTVTFPKDIGFPSIFGSKIVSYPPPREKCAGPSCMNPYKYRDSKTKLPLCSLQCYKAIHEKMKDEIAL